MSGFDPLPLLPQRLRDCIIGQYVFITDEGQSCSEKTAHPAATDAFSAHMEERRHQ